MLYQPKSRLVSPSAVQMVSAVRQIARAPAAVAAPGGVVVILSRDSGKVLAGAGPVGSKILTADYVKGDPSQLWRAVAGGDGYVYLEQAKTGLVLAVTGLGNGAEAVLAAKLPAYDRQLWKAVPVAKTKDTVVLQVRGGDRVLGIDARRKDSGARILLWSNNGGSSEFFALVPPP